MISFLLIIFYGNYSSVGGSLVTVFMNRIGDCMMVIMFFWIVILDQESVIMRIMDLSIMSMVLVIAVVTKSAQFPYSV